MLAEILISLGKITELELESVLELQKKSGKNIGEILIEKNFITEDEMMEVWEFELGIPYIDLDNYELDNEVLNLIPENIVRRYELIPISKKDDVLTVAMVDPLNIFALDDVKLHVKGEIKPVLTTREKTIEVIEKFYGGKSTKKALDEFVENYHPLDTVNLEDINQIEINFAPIVKLLNSIIEQAVKDKASDIHIEPCADEIRVRNRIDGDLREIMKLSKTSLSAIITRIKIIGKMNIAENRIAQDGRVEMKINGRYIDMRISTLPTVHGEKIVIRILDRLSFMFNKDSLGFSKKNLAKFDRILGQPFGMILVTGPTGSGKTTTLYTVLQELNKIEKNIITIEDPVEYKLDGINQVQLNIKAGLTFASGLKWVLRQDPDIVMIGEIRDNETAKIAVRAAITGHLVISTIHTNNSPSTIARLVDMGIEPYLVSSAIIGIVSQRLVKLLCPKCKMSYEAGYSEKNILDINEKKKLILYKPVGCNSCNKGYKGRSAVHELLPINESIRRLINRRADIDEIRNKAIEGGMDTLLQSASLLAIKGDTSFDEAIKVGFTL